MFGKILTAVKIMLRFRERFPTLPETGASLMKTPFLRALALATGVLLASLTAPISPATAETTHYSGTLADGATWIADKPSDWNGTLIVFSHGFGPLVAVNAPTPAVQTRLLAEGYALAGSSYDPNGPMWALNSAEADQFATITAAKAKIGTPRRVIALGSSMGGLVTAKMARDGAGRIDGALAMCGIVSGGVDLSNYQLDALYTLATFFSPADRYHLVGLPSQAEYAALADRLTTAIKTAQTTAAGRARIALAAAYLNLPDWFPGQPQPGRTDYEAQQAQQYSWIAAGLLNFIVPGRWSIEASAGGNTSWNTGVDYASLLKSSAYSRQVRSLYATAGISLRDDLATLNKGTRQPVNPTALAALRRSSTVNGSLGVPLLTVHTTDDNLVPAEHETTFAARVRAAGSSSLLRQAYVARPGHCAFTTAEVSASLRALDHRISSGRWGSVATASSLQAAATALGLDGAAFIRHTPPPLTGVR
jgi:pimeloyl-ACP methyl ester carboxylesterase